MAFINTALQDSLVSSISQNDARLPIYAFMATIILRWEDLILTQNGRQTRVFLNRKELNLSHIVEKAATLQCPL